MLRRRRLVTPPPAALLSLAVLAACATMRSNTDVPPHPVTITVVNNLPVPTDLSVYAVTTGGSVTILGTAAPGDSTQFQMTPRAFSEPYRLLARTPLGRRLWSDEYTVGDANTGEIRWQLVPNILQFFNVAEDSTVKPGTP
jgi:hypothetical protein